ncbi:hypothetical protein GF322_02315 [Candidatus Dependentiae bacterium]|nr:hypothetical protein [Candidatus Dependentiae bacterium]
MAIKLNAAGYDNAKKLIKSFEVECDPNNWEEVKPSIDEILRYLDSHKLEEYGLWFLGIDTQAPNDQRSKYVYPYGDFNLVQESALILAERQATEKNHDEIKKAAHELLQELAKCKQ